MSTCPDCKNQFSQPFLCVTCGAEKLYDATLEALKSELAALRTKLEEAERKLAEARREFMLLPVLPDALKREVLEEAAKACDGVAANPSSLWEEAGCWEHAAKNCAIHIRAKMKELDKANQSGNIPPSTKE